MPTHRDEYRVRSLHRWRAPVALAGVLALSPVVLEGQGVRVRGITTLRFLELRPFVDDSVPFNTTQPGAIEYRQLADGRVVRCVDGDRFCRFKRAGGVANALPVVQDLQVSGWGLGRGISMHADLRFRGAMGSQPALWPRAQDAFDALTAYVELDRPRYSARVGRQYATTGLGVYNYDGAMLTLRPSRKLTLEGFGGWSLAQGLNEPLTSSEIAAVDELPPDRNAFVVGAQLRVRPSTRSSVNAMYQRDVRVNRSALYAERIALDGTWRLGNAGLDGSFSQDLSANAVNEARARLSLPTVKRTTLSVEARRFRPFFELWTIWGAFSPVGFDEGRVQASWRSAAQTWLLDVHGAKRQWQETDAGLDFDPLRADGWRVGGNAMWRVTSAWHTNASYSADVGFGAARSEGDLGVRWERGRGYLGANVSAFQSIYEFRVGTGRVFGTGIDAGWQLNPDVRIVGDVSLYQQLAKNRAPTTDWTQHRATMRFEWMLGSDPGTRVAGATQRRADARARGEAALATTRAGRLPATRGAPAGGSPDAGSPDAGSPEAGSSDAGSPAGTPELRP